MNKKKIIIIGASVLVAGIGVSILTNPKYKLRLGLPVSYKSDADGEKYNLEMAIYGETVVITATQNGIPKGIVSLQDEQLVWQETRNGELRSIPITNDKDLAYFSKLIIK